MIKFLKIIWRSRFLVRARNFFVIKPQHRKWLYLTDSFSSSDAFFWRVDENFKTIFKYSDIFGKYFGEKSKILLVFLDSEGKHIISREIIFSRSVQTFLIDKMFLGRTGYGSFFAYNIPDNPNNFEYKVTNRCYTGFSYRSNGPSFVHGNDISRYLTAKDLIKFGKGETKSAIFDHSIKSLYAIQKDFSEFDKNELFFFNPMKKDLILNLNGTKYLIKSLCTFALEIENSHGQVTEIKSNYNFARPIVFSYKNAFLDVHHA